jgi:glutamyl-Q tRNA(Asp) synthetase
MRYVGRFAPSPTGLLHAGSLVAALASWLDARAHGGQWLVRIEDVDPPRCVPGAAEGILTQLAALGLQPDAAPVWQSRREDLYQSALEQLMQAGRAYPCGCSRKDIEDAWAAGGQHTAGRAPVEWFDRWLGPQRQDVEREVGDFVLRRADGLWAYQLAVVVDDAGQGVTDVVRGEDLVDNTARQVLLQGALGLPTPRYLHTPLVLGAHGEKLSKQNGAAPLATEQPLVCLQAAGAVLGLQVAGHSVSDWLVQAVRAWAAREGAGGATTKEA